MAATASGVVALWPAAVASQVTADSLRAGAGSLQSNSRGTFNSPVQMSKANFMLRQRQGAALVAQEAAARQAAAKKQAAERAAAAASAAAAQQRAAQQQAQPQPAQSSPPSQAPPAPSGSPQQIAMGMLGSSSQFSCLDPLWNQESGWNVFASNPTSGAYGIPQALPGSKMASAGSDWATNPATQIKWGLGYITQIYGTPCGAWNFELANGYY